MRREFKKGFTMIELALSMIFVGILSLTIVLIIKNITDTYQRGLTLNQINTVGMDLVDDMRSAVQNASSKSLLDYCVQYYSVHDHSVAREDCIKDGADKFVRVERIAHVKVGSEDVGNVAVSGAFCTGTYSYIWNSGYFFNGATITSAGDDGAINRASLMYKNGSKSNFRILKVRDTNRGICVSTVRGTDIDDGHSTEYENAWWYNNSDNIYKINGDLYPVVSEEPVELILDASQNTDTDLLIYDLEVAKAAESTTQGTYFYAVSFILGTKRGGINVMSKGQNCEPPNDDAGDFNYCAINKFNFAAQANGG